MGCFLHCFTSSRHRKRHQTHEAPEAVHNVESAKGQEIETPIAESKDNLDEIEKLKRCAKNEVTFDSNVKSSEKLSTMNLVQTSTGNENEKKAESPNKIESGCNLAENDFDAGSKEDKPDKKRDDEGCGDGDGDGEATFLQDECSESLFSISIDSRKQVSVVGETSDKEVNSPMSILDSPGKKPKTIGSILDSAEEELKTLGLISLDSTKQVSEVGETGDKEVNSPVSIFDLPEKKLKPLGSNLNPHSVLSSVENIHQCKSAKTRIVIPTSKHQQDKENIGFEHDSVGSSCKILANKPMNRQKNPAGQDFAIDASLSSWLCLAGNNSPSEEVNSERSYEDKAFFRESSVEEIGESRRQSGIVLGTIGSYWSHTGKTSDSDLLQRSGELLQRSD